MKTRMHPSIIFERLLSSLGAIIVIAGYFFIQVFQDEGTKGIEKTSSYITSLGGNIILTAIIVFILTLAVFAIFFYFGWRNTYLYFEKTNLIIEKGKIFKKITTIHLSDIAAVNIKRNIIEQLLGTSNLKFDLNMSEANSFNSKLVFKEDVAINLKNDILKHMGKNIELENKEIDSIVSYKPVDVFRHMWLSVDISAFIVLIAVYGFIIIAGINDLLAQGLIFIIIIGIIAVVPLIWSLVKSYLSYYNFKVSRAEDTIKLSYGAFTNYKYSLPINRINAVIIKQTIQARIANYYEIEVVNAGLGGNENEDEKTIISLYVKEKEKNIILNEIVPEYQNQIKLKNQTKQALIHYLLAKLPLIIVFLGLCALSFWFIIGAIFLIVIAFAQYKTKEIGYDNNMIVIQNGIINKKTTVVKFSNIELISIHKKLLTPISKMYSLQANIIGPLQNSNFNSGLFQKSILENIVNQYLGETNEN